MVQIQKSQFAMAEMNRSCCMNVIIRNRKYKKKISTKKKDFILYHLTVIYMRQMGVSSNFTHCKKLNV